LEQLFNVAIFALFLVLWAAFAYGLVANQGGIDATWKSIRGLPLVVQGLVWLLFLPLTIGLWIWETTWPAIVRVSLVLAIGMFNVWLFLPTDVLPR
jgi:hypothetical protein